MNETWERAASRTTPFAPTLVSTGVTIRPARMHDVNAILALHSEIFADKFIGAFGSGGIGRGVQALATLWYRQGHTSLQGMVVAEWQGNVIGTVMLRTDGMEQNYPVTTEVVFQQVLGLWGAVRSIFALSLLSHHIKKEEGFITDVAVMDRFRRQGVARLLLQYCEKEARSQQKTYLGLYVSGANSGARTLYEKVGFKRVRVRRSWLMRMIFGQRDWIYMRKDLS
jgi:ribosomal protein S18 acetylase RimI-like enzyme